MDNNKKIYSLQDLNFLKNSHLKIGLFGGSFNPAHLGHVVISEQALKTFGFDYVIWLVANQNPFKNKYVKNIQERAEQALEIIENNKILISTLEEDLESKYTYDTLRKLIIRFPNTEFSWLMGIDGLETFHNWYKHDEITKLCKMIIFDRPVHDRLVNYSRFFSKYKPIVAKSQSSNIIVCRGMLSSLSSTLIRNISKIN